MERIYNVIILRIYLVLSVEFGGKGDHQENRLEACSSLHPTTLYHAKTISILTLAQLRLCHKSAHGSTGSPRTDHGILEIN